MGRSRGGLTTKIHALVDAEGRPVRLELTAAKPAMHQWLRNCSLIYNPDRRFSLTGHMIQTPSGTSPENASPGQTYQRRSTARKSSASAAGSIASATSSSGSLMVSNRCGDWQPDTTGAQTTTWPHSNWQPSEYGPLQITSPLPSRMRHTPLPGLATGARDALGQEYFVHLPTTG